MPSALGFSNNGPRRDISAIVRRCERESGGFMKRCAGGPGLIFLSVARVQCTACIAPLGVPTHRPDVRR
jgi:hypothetical protein